MFQQMALAILSLVGFMAVAQSSPGEITPIEGADLVCVYGEGGMIAINATDERVWQANPGDVEGLELKVVRFDRSRCPNTYDIQAKLMVFGEEADVQLTTTSCGHSDITLEYKIGDEVLEMKCEMQNNR